jgi:hypothetical protein
MVKRASDRKVNFHSWKDDDQAAPKGLPRDLHTARIPARLQNVSPEAQVAVVLL